MATTVRTWLEGRLPAIGSIWLSNQAALQAHFYGRHNLIANPLTRRVYKKLVARVGKFVWGQSQPNPAAAGKFAHWNRTKRSTQAENTVSMNCWEMVLYGLYQAHGVDVGKLQRYYNLLPATTPADFDAKQRPLFGTATPYVAGAPNPGDILTFESNANNMLNHMGMYAGNFGGLDYIIHLLSLDAASTGMGGFGCLHFERVQTTIDRYAGTGGCNAFYTAPFWQAGSPTNAYFAAL